MPPAVSRDSSIHCRSSEDARGGSKDSGQRKHSFWESFGHPVSSSEQSAAATVHLSQPREHPDKQENIMPICYLDAPRGIQPQAKRKMVERITAAMNAAFPIPDVRIFFREYAAAEVSQDGSLAAGGVRAVFSMSVPRLGSIVAKRVLIDKINAAIAEGYQGLAAPEWIMVFIDEYPLENVGLAGVPQADRPEVVRALTPIANAA
jgi:phenylpyruvate tautomerase PptA (4-oxalocrotonate tautomerase family)